MNANLDNIAKELYGKIQTRFPDIQMGDENAAVLSKKEDIPKARFFEFEYQEDGEPLGTVAITLDEDDGVVIQVSGDLVTGNNGRPHHNAFKFIRSFRSFAKDRLLNFDIQNLGKSNLDKRIVISGTYSSGKTTTTNELSRLTGIPCAVARGMREILPETFPGKRLEECSPSELVQLGLIRFAERKVLESKIDLGAS